jgi:hypothetical protein
LGRLQDDRAPNPFAETIKAGRILYEANKRTFEQRLALAKALRQFYHRFPAPGDRSPGCSWTVHLKAGDPETLRAVIKQAHKEGLKPEEITTGYVADFKEQRRLEQERKNRRHNKLKGRPESSVKHRAALMEALADFIKAQDKHLPFLTPAEKQDFITRLEECLARTRETLS